MSRGEPTGWITVNGNHVPLYAGESKTDAVKRFTEGKKEKVIYDNKKDEKENHSNETVKEGDDDILRRGKKVDIDSMKPPRSGKYNDVFLHKRNAKRTDPRYLDVEGVLVSTHAEKYMDGRKSDKTYHLFFRTSKGKELKVYDKWENARNDLKKFFKN